jgi:Ca-activated chloride channel family protein
MWLVPSKYPLALALLSLPGGTSVVASQASDEAFRISVSLELVVLHATVHNGKNRVAVDLPREAFTVVEDGVQQSLRLFRHEDTPVTVGLIVDHSGSMRPKLLDVASASRLFVEASRGDDEMFIVNFNETPRLGLPPAIPFTNRPDLLERAISGSPASGQTALYDATLEGLKRLERGKHEKKAIIVISDGADNASSHTMAQLLAAAQQSSALIYAIGIFAPDDPDSNPQVLRRLARITGGDAFFPEGPAAIKAACQTIAREIRGQYTLGYVSSNPPRPGAAHSIRVRAQSPPDKLTVRTRTGYISAGKSLE